MSVGEFRKSGGLAAKAETLLKFGGVSYLEANYKYKIDLGCQVINTQTIGQKTHCFRRKPG